MEFDPDLVVKASADQNGLGALRHRYRNQIQTMLSLASLFGRRYAAGETRRAFENLRARFEALTFLSFDEGETGDVDLPELVARTFSILDPKNLHRIEVRGAALRAPYARGSALAQILAECLIDLHRTGLGDLEPGEAEVSIDVSAGGGVAITVASATGRPVDAASDVELGRTLAEAAIRNLGGALTRGAAGPYSCRVEIPADECRR